MGSAIAFAGDAVTCWFDGDSGLHATASALAMQDDMRAFSAIQTPFGSTVIMTMKVAVAVGPARRFLVGDPEIRVLEAVAGATLERLAAAEHLASSGEVILAPCASVALADVVEAHAVGKMRRPAATSSWSACACPFLLPPPPLAPDALAEERVRAWLLLSVYERLRSGLGEFLAELRPTVALFLRFTGIDYDGDDTAGAKLDAFIRWVQTVVQRYEGTLIDLNIGDKGSYLYVNFGAPIAHENNAARTAAAALDCAIRRAIWTSSGLCRSASAKDKCEPGRTVAPGTAPTGYGGSRESGRAPDDGRRPWPGSRQSCGPAHRRGQLHLGESARRFGSKARANRSPFSL